jgi:hypothetical protein
MQYTRAILVFVIAFGLVSPALGQSPTPSTVQAQNMARLQNFGTMVAFLNLASGTVRLVVIVDPVSDGSVAALKAVQSVLESNPSKRLRAYVVWSAVTADGTEMRALSRSDIHDRRLVYFYDPEGFVSNAFRNVVGSGQGPATDVLLLYDTDAHLAPEPPAPSMWMSANKDIKGTALDAPQLGAHANEMVRRVEEKVNDGAPQKQ